MTVLACNLGAFDVEQRGRYQQVTERLMDVVEEFHELPEGYKFRCPSDESTVLNLAEFIALERLCCPFFTFNLEVEANSGPVWLYITGPEGVKDFILSEFGLET